MNRVKTKVLVAVVALLLPLTAMSTSLIKMSTEQMTGKAAVIVHGRCTGVSSQWIDGALVTKATIAVEDNLKGGAVAQLTLVIPGGVDRARAVPVAVTVPGLPALRRNDEMVLFLDKSAQVADAYSPVGFSQGLYTVVNTEAGAFATRAAGGDTQRLAAFKQKIRSMLK